jgi:NAD(P)-dependent dehydrogenase (short-subunit alcohol dehydrogenase family)
LHALSPFEPTDPFLMQTRPLALVTGGNRGIGREVCRQLAGDHDFTVLLTARNPGDARAAADALRDEGLDVVPEQLDVTVPASVQAAKNEIQERFGRLDALVNNAGTDYDTDQEVLTADLDRVRNTFETNTLGPWRVAQAFLPLLRESPSARIVNVSSGAGALASLTGGTPGYSLSKAGLNALTLMMAARLDEEGILVNAVGPGWVRTRMGGSDANRSVEEGARSVVWGVTLPDDGPTGGFFRDGERIDW